MNLTEHLVGSVILLIVFIGWAYAYIRYGGGA